MKICSNSAQYFNFRLLSIFLVLLNLCACLRYVPARNEIVDDKGEHAEYAGVEAFFSIERLQQQRLETLIRSRSTRSTSSSAPTYRIGSGDVLQLSVFDVEEMNRKVRVRPDGHISLPLVGLIKAAGRTEEELQHELAEKLEAFMYDPQVALFIEEYTAHKVWVIGEIKQPGAYALTRDNYSLIELLSEAGGRTERAGSTIVIIPRSERGKPTPRPLRAQLHRETDQLRPSDTKHLQKSLLSKRYGIEVPFDALVGTIEQTPLEVPLRPGDTIVVPEVGTVQVDGEVTEPGSFQLASRMTLLGAVAAAGGLTYSADVEKVEVLRELGGGKKALITVDLEEVALKQGNDIRLRNGDYIRVPSSRGRFATRQTITVLNSIFGRVKPF